MSESRFPICTPEIHPLLGREGIMQGLVAELTKTSPSHRSVVGPRYSGKSVILKHLASEMRANVSPYCCVMEWDLRHGTPQTDQDFLSQLCSKLGDGLKGAGQPEYGEHLRSVSEGHYAEICEVFDALDSDGLRVLMIWDGFDKPLCAGTLTRNLWDNLLELCRKPSFRLVTATRRELSDLIRDEKSVTSDFWGIFGDVVRVGPFDDKDIETIINTLDGFEFQGGAKTELANWTAGYPPLLLAILNTVVRGQKHGPVNHQDINAAAEATLESIAPVLGDLWADCSPGAQDLYLELIDARTVPVTKTGPERKELAEKGFARFSGQRVEASCRLLERHIQRARPALSSMARLFGDEVKYQANIADLLQRRLAQIAVEDAQLQRFVEIAVRLLPNDPEPALNNLTSIEERVLNIVCRREFGSDQKIPQPTIAYWTQSPRDENNAVKKMMNDDDWTVPPNRLTQLRLLQLLTGSQDGFDSKALCTSKDAYVLLNAIHSYRNRNQHADGQEMHLGVAVAAMMTCIELLACLDRDTPTP